MDFKKLIDVRESCRAYTGEPVDSKDLDAILRAGRMSDEDIAENVETVLTVLDRNLEKGRNQIKSMYIKATMGSVVRVI